MALDNLALETICSDLQSEMENAYFDKPFALGLNQFALPYHSGHNKENKGRGTFIISMDPSNPYVSFSLEKFAKVSLNTPFFNTLKKLSGVCIKRISKFRGERIVLIETEIVSKTIETIDTGYDLVIELFPQRPNIYFIPQPYNKVSALYKESGDVFSARYIARGLPYLPPPNREPLTSSAKGEKEVLNCLSRSTGRLFADYEKEVGFRKALSDLLSSRHLYLLNNSLEPFSFGRQEAKLIETKDIYGVFVKDQKELAKRMSLSSLEEEIKKLIGIAKKKKEHLEEDLEASKSRLNYMDCGQELYLHQTEYKPGLSSMDLDGLHIVLDPHKNLVGNANSYFKKYRKAKLAYQTLGPLIEKAEAEIDYLSAKLLEIDKGTNEDILELKQELTEEGYFKDNKQLRGSKKPLHQIVPHYLKNNDYKIGFGMNAYQNEELTFKIASKESVFLHVKDGPGSHVVILAGDSEKTRLLAAELALFLSDKDEGDVIVAPLSKVKKSKEKKGLVNLLEYKLLTLHSIRPDSKKMFEEALRMD
jgi:predicted ribosome quality control (RQC) complex YloA/Tae2 family protein